LAKTFRIRKSSIFLILTIVNVTVFLLLMHHARSTQTRAGELLASSSRLAKELQLTDLCLFTEARYTRHPAMGDVHAAFQDHPLALEHFPSGSLVPAPGPLVRHHE
jgi:hypothetical protein